MARWRGITVCLLASSLFQHTAYADPPEISLPGAIDPIRLAQDEVSQCLSFSKDGKTLAAVGASGRIRLWDWRSGTARDVPQHKDAQAPNEALGDGTRLALWSINEPVRRWDIAAGKEEDSAKSSTQLPLTFRPKKLLSPLWMSGAHFDKDKRYSMALNPVRPGGDPRAYSGVVLRDEHGKRLAEDREFNPFVGDQRYKYNLLCISPDGRTLAMAAHQRDLEAGTIAPPLPPGQPPPLLGLWDTATGRMRRRLALRDAPAVVQAVFSGDGKMLAVEWDQRLLFFDADTGEEVGQVSTDGGLEGLCFSANGEYIAARAIDNRVDLWEVRSGMRVFAFGEADADPFQRLALSADGSAFAAVQGDKVLVWDLTLLPARRNALPRAKDERQLERLWEQLGSAEGGASFDAMQALVSAPDQAVDLIGKQLRPVRLTVDPKPAIKDLANPQFSTRTRALARLTEMGDLARPALLQTARDAPSLEVHRLAQRLLDKLAQPQAVARLARGLRAIEVLEKIGSPKARAVLADVARGLPEHRAHRRSSAGDPALARRKRGQKTCCLESLSSARSGQQALSPGKPGPIRVLFS